MRRIVLSRFGLILSAVLTAARFCLGAAPEKIDFQTQIRPILSDKCFFCHGPDDEKRKAQYKLEAMLMEGIQSGEPTEMTRQDWADIRKEALRQFEARKVRKKA